MSEFIKRKFSLDGGGNIYKGYCFEGDHWNGWACPYLPYDEMIRFCLELSHPNFWMARFDFETDAFYFYCLTDFDFDSFQHSEQFPIKGQVINGIKLYPIHEQTFTFVYVD